MRVKYKFAAVLLAGLALLLACDLTTTHPSDLARRTLPAGLSGPELTAIATAQPFTPTPTLTPTPFPGLGPYDFPGNVNPLTGLRVKDPNLLERRPVAVKINNYPRNDRPQWGLSLADIVYEYYHNNDLPRFHAVFYGQDADQIGPVRSARLFDDYLVDMYKTIFVFGSADYRVMDRLNESDYANRLIYLLDGQCPPSPVCRYDPAGSNYLVTNTTAPGRYMEALGVSNDRPRLEGMWFYKKTPLGGEPLRKAYLRYSYSAYLYWEYDPAQGRYLRFQDTIEDFTGEGERYAPLTDALNGRQVAAENVVFLFVPHSFFHYVPPQDGRPAVEVVDMDFNGSGRAYAMRDGSMYELLWARSKQNLVYLTYPDGSRFPFKPGTTWFQILGSPSTIEKANKQWKFFFHFSE